MSLREEGASAMTSSSGRKRRFARKQPDLVIEEALVAQYTPQNQPAMVRSWEPERSGTAQVFGVVAQRSQWDRSASPAAGS